MARLDLDLVEAVEALLDCWAIDPMIPLMGGVSLGVEDVGLVESH